MHIHHLIFMRNLENGDTFWAGGEKKAEARVLASTTPKMVLNICSILIKKITFCKEEKKARSRTALSVSVTAVVIVTMVL